MGFGAERGRRAIVAALVASASAACSGRSERADEGGGSAGGLAGATAGSIGSTGGAGSSDTCPECADDHFRIVIDGHGGPREMAWNGSSGAADPMLALCGEQPLRGSVAGCGRALSFMACSGPMNEPPCLEVRGIEVSSIDEQGGTWSGVVQRDTPDVPQRPGVASGTLIVHINGANGSLVVHGVSYTLCVSSERPLVPC
jgi:hypothetical protein